MLQISTQHEHLAARMCLGERRRHAQPVHRAVTAHEADVRPRHVAPQTEPFDQSDVDSRCAEAAARDRDQMDDLVGRAAGRGKRSGAARAARSAASAS